MSILKEPTNYERALSFGADLDSFKNKYFSNVAENINLETIANFSQEERLSFLGLDNDTDYSIFKLTYSKIEEQFHSLKKILEEEKFPDDIKKFSKLKELYLAVAEKIVLNKIREQIRTFIEELPIQEKQKYILYSYSSNSLLIENIGKVLRNQDVSLLYEDENFNKSVADNLAAFTSIKEYLERNNNNQPLIQSFDLRFLEPLKRVQQAFRQEEEKKIDLKEQKFATPSFDPRSFNIAFFDGDNFVGSASDLIKSVMDQIDGTPLQNEVDKAKVTTTLEKIAARILELNKKILTDLPVYQNLKRKIDGLNRDLASLLTENLSAIKQHRSTL